MLKTRTEDYFDAVLSTSTTGDNTVVAATPGKKIHVKGGLVICSAATNIRWWSTSSAGTALSGVLAVGASMGHIIPYIPVGNFRTAVGQPLVLNMSSAGTLGGWIVCALE
jgi:hypothetical protein